MKNIFNTQEDVELQSSLDLFLKNFNENPEELDVLLEELFKILIGK